MEQDTPQTEPAKPAQRLCSEIQLFDLCDLDRCAFKNGRFCTQKELLARFEQLPDEEELTTSLSGPDQQGGEQDTDEMLYSEEDEFDDLADGFDPEEDDWQD